MFTEIVSGSIKLPMMLSVEVRDLI